MTSLILAVKKKSIEIIKLLLSSENIDVNAQYILSDEYESVKIPKEIDLPDFSDDEELDPEILDKKSSKIERTALHIAVENENIEIVELLLENKNIDINNISIYSNTTKFCDPRQGDYTGESNETTQNKEETPLIIAIEKENIEIIKLLLSNKSIDVNLPYVLNEYKKEEMNIAERKYHNYGSYYGDDSTTISDCMSPLNFAIEKNNIEIVKLLLAVKDIDINFERKYSEKGYHEYRGDCNDDVIKERTTLLYQAVKNKNNEIVQLLISNENINVNIKNYLYANHENYYGDRDTEFNSEKIIKNETSLYLAVKKGYGELVQYYLIIILMSIWKILIM